MIAFATSKSYRWSTSAWLLWKTFLNYPNWSDSNWATTGNSLTVILLLFYLTVYFISIYRISNGLDYLANSPDLEYLNLCGNRFKDLSSLNPLVCYCLVNAIVQHSLTLFSLQSVFTKLEILDLFNCEVTELDGYRAKVFELLPKYVFSFTKFSSVVLTVYQFFLALNIWMVTIRTTKR